MKKFLLSATALLLLSGCVSQDQADEKMEKGCRAGVDALLGSAQIMQVKSTNYSFENNLEGQHRRITLETTIKDGWLEKDETYSCLFAQQWGLFKSSHAAVLVQVKFPDGKIVGKQDGLLVGELSDFVKLSDTVQDAMQ
jgi:hypothetical protein